MLKKITGWILAVIMICSTVSLSSCGIIESKNPEREDVVIPSPGTSEADLYNETYVQIAESDSLILEYNELTTDIRVTVKDTGYVWSTEYTEYDADLDMEMVSRGEIFTLDYYNNSGLTSELNSAYDSVEKGQFKAERTDNGIKIAYGVGDVDYRVKFPMALSVKRYEEWTAKMDETQLGRMSELYTLIDFESAAYKDSSKDEIEVKKNQYPLAANGEKWYYMTGITNPSTVNEMNEFWAQIGYTDDDAAIDNESISMSTLKSYEFAVTIEYKLENDDLIVSVPEDQIYFHKDYVLESISLCRNLMSFDATTEGYYLLPDGSGSIMNFNNGKDKIRNESVYVQMYGVDASRNVEEKTANYNDAVLPVFGSCVKGRNTNARALKASRNEDNYNGVFGIIESGDAFAGIEAHSSDVDEMESNWMFPEFRINECIRMATFGSSTQDETHSKFQFQHYLGDIRMRLHFLTGADATYSGMANYYSNFLFGDEATAAKDYYSTVETIGLVNGQGLFFGIPYNTKEALTSFKQVENIASDLKKSGFDNMAMKIAGWCNGGYEHGWLNKIYVSKELGGEDEFNEMLKELNKLGVKAYPDADIQYVYMAQDRVPKSKSASTISGTVSYVGRYNPMSFFGPAMLPAVALNMDSFEANLTGFMDSYKKYDNSNVSFRSIGSQINANYKEDVDFMDRQETMENMLKNIAAVKKDGYSIMGTGGQAPFLKYLDIVNDMPCESANLDKCDYSVPFTAMVLSGHADYTYKTMNLSSGEQKDLLRMIESGAGTYLKLTNQIYNEISLTGYDFLYSTVYNDIKDDIKTKYNYVKKALDGVYGLSITHHEQLADEVFKSTYENGTSFYINYSNENYKTKDGKTVKANDYLRVEGDGANG